jgi:lysozyme family protein
MPRLAKSLASLRDLVNARWPDRSKLSDGWIGDAAHAARPSDHNPNGAGVVTALDITHDPDRGPDTWKLAELLRINKDPRIKYVISNGRIFSSVVSPWRWRPYTGANKHAHHVHISVSSDPVLYDLASSWKIDGPINSSDDAPRPGQAAPKGITLAMRRRMAKAIIDFEARRISGKLAVYRLPSNDGGGTFEVAGINDRYHPQQAAKLKALIEAGRHDEAELAAANYLVAYTNVAGGWTEYAGVEFYLRDSVFNRGPKGAARILQRGLGVDDDGEIGPTTRAAMDQLTADEILTRLRAGREDYERAVVGYRANFWKGLVNRWDKALVAAREFQREQGALPFKKTVGTSAATAVVAMTFWDWIVAHPILSAVIAASALTILVLGIRQLKASREKPPAQPVAPTPAIIEQEHP